MRENPAQAIYKVKLPITSLFDNLISKQYIPLSQLYIDNSLKNQFLDALTTNELTYKITKININYWKFYVCFFDLISFIDRKTLHYRLLGGIFSYKDLVYPDLHSVYVYDDKAPKFQMTYFVDTIEWLDTPLKQIYKHPLYLVNDKILKFVTKIINLSDSQSQKLANIISSSVIE